MSSFRVALIVTPEIEAQARRRYTRLPRSARLGYHGACRSCGDCCVRGSDGLAHISAKTRRFVAIRERPAAGTLAVPVCAHCITNGIDTERNTP